MNLRIGVRGPRARAVLVVCAAALACAAMSWAWVRFAPGRLHRLAREGDLAGVRFALSLGADPNAKAWDDSGYWGGIRPLMAAVEWEQPEIVAVLLDAGADIEASDALGQTALSRAVFRPEILKMLLQRGANPSRCEPANDGEARLPVSPVYLALTEGGEESIRAFLLAGVDPRSQCFLRGLSDGLLRRGRVTDAALAEALVLARGGLDGMEGDLLLSAAEGGAELGCLALLDMGVAVDVRGHKGRTPLMCAARGGSAEVARLLLARGADIALQDNGGKDALRYLGDAESSIPADRFEETRRVLARASGDGMPGPDL